MRLVMANHVDVHTTRRVQDCPFYKTRDDFRRYKSKSKAKSMSRRLYGVPIQ